jgi:hypothetical protein
MVSDHGGMHRLSVAKPRQVWLATCEETGNRVDEDGISRPTLEPTGLFERADTLNPTVAFGTRGPLGAFAPEDAKPQGPLGAIVGRLDAVLCQKDPEGGHLPQQAASEPSCLIGTIMILLDQAAQTSVPGSPLASSGWGSGHMTQAVQLGKRPSPTRRETYRIFKRYFVAPLPVAALWKPATGAAGAAARAADFLALRAAPNALRQT